MDLNLIDLSEQNSDLMQVDEYAFESENRTKPIETINLSNNRMARLSDKAFCAHNNSIYLNSRLYANVREVDLSGNSLGWLKACILRQLAFFDDREVTFRPTITFKASQQQNDDEQHDGAILCDCEVTRASHFVELDGECKNASGVLVPLSQFKCGDASALSAEETNRMCDKKFDCAHRTATTIPLTELASAIEVERDNIRRSRFVTATSAATSHCFSCYSCCHLFSLVLITKKFFYF